MEVNRSLVEAASSEQLPLKLSGKPGRVSAEQLETTLRLFRYVAFVIHRYSKLYRDFTVYRLFLENALKYQMT